MTEKAKTVPMMYWIPKTRENPTGARFIIVSKICSTNVNLFLLSLSSYTPKLKTFMEMLYFYETIRSFESLKILTTSFNH